MTAPAIELELLARGGCHLCEEARATLREVSADAGVEVRWRETDIDADDELHRRYLERIPVIRRDGHDLCELVIEPADLRAALGLPRGEPGPARTGY